jgi:D-inositol-3-phosphate glycosyltransferase
VLSLHTSPLVQPGVADAGGMNVYVRELVSALAQAGVDCTVYVRTWRDGLPAEVAVEPGFRVRHIDAGPPSLAKEALPETIDAFADGVRADLERGHGADVIHANYWLSGLAGHRLKHELGLPLVSTFHPLARVKAESGDAEPERRVRSELEIIGCSDAILASCTEEAAQFERLYGASPGRVEIVPPGVDHAFFSPGDRRGARAALKLGDHPVLLFVGRIQALKGLDVAVRALAALDDPEAMLVVVGGPSGKDGDAYLAEIESLAESLGVGRRIRFVPPQPHHLLSSYYRAADVCLVPSRSESFGLVALEAAACGTPVVAAAVGGLRTLVDHGHSGFLVEGRDPEVFAAYTAELLANPVLAESMSVAAATRAARYTWSTSAARLRRLYADLAVGALLQCS